MPCTHYAQRSNALHPQSFVLPRSPALGPHDNKYRRTRHPTSFRTKMYVVTKRDVANKVGRSFRRRCVSCSALGRLSAIVSCDDKMASRWFLPCCSSGPLLLPRLEGLLYFILYPLALDRRWFVLHELALDPLTPGSRDGGGRRKTLFDD